MSLSSCSGLFFFSLSSQEPNFLSQSISGDSQNREPLRGIVWEGRGCWTIASLADKVCESGHLVLVTEAIISEPTQVMAAVMGWPFMLCEFHINLHQVHTTSHRMHWHVWEVCRSDSWWFQIALKADTTFSLDYNSCGKGCVDPEIQPETSKSGLCT